MAVRGDDVLTDHVTRLIRDEIKAAGPPPGAGDAAFAKLHAGSVKACVGL
jgi:hypothetical protein